MKTCAKCDQETKSNYLIRQYGFLCSKCAEEHGNKKIKELRNEILILESEISTIAKEIRQAIENDCEHKFESTGYSRSDKTNGVYKFYDIQRCIKCGLEKEVDIKF